MAKAKYTIKLDAFEGPMDLLMHLIEKNKIDIYNIPMAELTSQYLDYLDAMREFNMEIASSFLVMAATLLQIKSRMMLPKPPKEDEEEEPEDPRQELVNRLLEYRRFRLVSQLLDSRQDTQERYVARDPMPLPVHHLPPDSLPIKALWEAFQTLLVVKKELTIPKALVDRETWNIEGQMEKLLSELSRSGGVLPFREAFPSGTRGELIATFLALLELLKLRTITVRQPHPFAEIVIMVRQDNGEDKEDKENMEKEAEQDAAGTRKETGIGK